MYVHATSPELFLSVATTWRAPYLTSFTTNFEALGLLNHATTKRCVNQAILASRGRVMRGERLQEDGA